MFRGFHAPLIYAEKGVIFRYLLMVILFIIVCLAFWYSFGSTFKDLQVDKRIIDKTQTMKQEEYAKLVQLSESFQQLWGIRLLIHLCEHTVLLPKVKGNTLFIGISRLPGQTILIFPPIVRQLLSKNVAQQFEHKLSLCSQTQRSLADCASDTLTDIYTLLLGN